MVKLQLNCFVARTAPLVSPEGSEVDKSSPDTRKTSAASTTLAFHESGNFPSQSAAQQQPTNNVNNNNSTVYLNAATVDESSTDDVIDKHGDSISQPIVPPRPSKESSGSSASSSSHSSHHSSPSKKELVIELKDRSEEEINASLSSQINQMLITEKKDEDTKQTSVEEGKQREQENLQCVVIPKIDDKEQEESSLSSQHWGPERTVDVVRVPGHGLGISIVGGKIDPLPRKGAKQGTTSAAVTGIFIKNVLEGSPAGTTGELCTGDRILEVDGHNLRKASHEKAVEIIRQSGTTVVFVVQSLLAYDDDDEEDEDELEEEIANRDVEERQSVDLINENLATNVNTQNMTTSTFDNIPSTIDSIPPVPPPGFENEYSEDRLSDHSDSDPSTLPPPPPPPMMENMDGSVNWGGTVEEKGVVNDESESDEDSDDSNHAGQVTLPNGILIDRSSAAFLPKSKKDMEVEDDYGYTTNKVHRKYMKDSQDRGVPKLVSLNKGTNGLGISLAGHKDRSQMAIYICGLNPLGNAARVGGIGKLNVKAENIMLGFL